MTIILSFNDPYAPHAATVMASIIAHASDKIDFAVLHASLSEKNQTVLTEYFKNQVHSLKFYKIDPSFIAQVSSIQAAPHLLHVKVIAARGQYTEGHAHQGAYKGKQPFLVHNRFHIHFLF